MSEQRPTFFDNYAPTERREHRLPHWQQGDVACFITWRLADSLSSGLLRQWRREREAWLQHHPQPWSDETQSEYHVRFSDEFDRWLDRGSGECVLRDPAHAQVVASALLHFDGDRYEMDAFVVMPNHVHVLARPRSSHAFSQIVFRGNGIQPGNSIGL